MATAKQPQSLDRIGLCDLAAQPTAVAALGFEAHVVEPEIEISIGPGDETDQLIAAQGYERIAAAALRESGARRILFSDAYAQYMAATRMKARGRDAFEHVWKRIKPELGHLYVEELDTSSLDAFKQTLPGELGPKSVNQHLILIRAVLRYLWKRGKLRSVPYIPMESVPKPHVDWYTEEERDQLLGGMFRLEPQWYLFYYLTARLGLRTGGCTRSRRVRSVESLASSWWIRRCNAGPRREPRSSCRARTTRRTRR